MKCGNAREWRVEWYTFSMRHVITRAKAISSIDAMKNFAIIGVTSEVVGVFSAIININTVKDKRVVITKVTRSPVLGGSMKVNNEARVIRMQGMTRLFK